METFFILSFCAPARAIRCCRLKRDSTDDGLLFLPWNTPSLSLQVSLCPVECMTVPFFGVRRGPDTIYLMLVTQHSGTVCPARLLYYFNVYRLLHRTPPSFFFIFSLSLSLSFFFLLLKRKENLFDSFFWVKGIHCFQPRAYAPLCIIM